MSALPLSTCVGAAIRRQERPASPDCDRQKHAAAAAVADDLLWARSDHPRRERRTRGVSPLQSSDAAPARDQSSRAQRRTPTLATGRLRKPTEFALLLADGPSSTRQLAADLLAVGACKHPMVLVGLGTGLCGCRADHRRATRAHRANRGAPPDPTGCRGGSHTPGCRRVQPIDPGVRIAPVGAKTMRAPYVRRSVACGLAIARRRRQRAVVDRPIVSGGRFRVPVRHPRVRLARTREGGGTRRFVACRCVRANLGSLHKCLPASASSEPSPFGHSVCAVRGVGRRRGCSLGLG